MSNEQNGLNELSDPEYRKFVQNIIDNIKKNGFPERKVAFGLERLYDAAEKKGINLNRVLKTLDDIQIAHEKSPEKIIFFPKPEKQVEVADSSTSEGFDPGMFENIDMSMFAGLDPAVFAGLDLNNIKNMSLPQMMGMVGKLMKKLTPEQMNSIKNMYDNMSEEQKSSIMDKAKDFNIFGKKPSPGDKDD
jgi:hypothetical protein